MRQERHPCNTTHLLTILMHLNIGAKLLLKAPSMQAICLLLLADLEANTTLGSETQDLPLVLRENDRDLFQAYKSYTCDD
jgi:hypothetical protein